MQACAAGQRGGSENSNIFETVPRSIPSRAFAHAVNADRTTNPMTNLQTVHPRLKPIFFDSKLPNGGIFRRPQMQNASAPVAGITGALYTCMTVENYPPGTS